MPTLPNDLRGQVIAECYSRAIDQDWDALTFRERSRVYDDWVDDPQIGGRLAAFLTRERVRVWLKDVPMKEFSRALAGIGPLSSYVPLQMPGPQQIIDQVEPEKWTVDPDSLKIKPNRVVIRNGDTARLLIWGGSRSFRDLIWSAMTSRVDDNIGSVVVLALGRADHLTTSEIRRQKALGRLAQIEVHHTTVAPQRR